MEEDNKRKKVVMIKNGKKKHLTTKSVGYIINRLSMRFFTNTVTKVCKEVLSC